MRKLLTITALVLFMALASPMWAQTNDVYWTHPIFDADPTPWAIQIMNPGEQGTPISKDHGTVCADIYVFDANQEMLACCNCKITANGTLTLFTSSDLVGNPLTGVQPERGGIKLVSDQGANCDATNPIPTPDLRAWAISGNKSYSVFQAASLQADEQQFLGQACAFVLYLGSGQGKCNCRPTVT